MAPGSKLTRGSGRTTLARATGPIWGTGGGIFPQVGNRSVAYVAIPRAIRATSASCDPSSGRADRERRGAGDHLRMLQSGAASAAGRAPEPVRGGRGAG